MSERNPWRVGESGYIDGRHIDRARGTLYQARVLEVGPMTIPADGEPPLSVPGVRLQITYRAEAFGRAIEQTWTHPHPVPARFLKRTPYDRERRGGLRVVEQRTPTGRKET